MPSCCQGLLELWPHQGGLDERDRGLGGNGSEAVEKDLRLVEAKSVQIRDGTC